MSISVKELRDGNFIHIMFEGKKEVHELALNLNLEFARKSKSNDFMVYALGSEDVGQDRISGIRLTPEILEKCGFAFNPAYDYKDGSYGRAFVRGNYLVSKIMDEHEMECYGLSWWGIGHSELNIGGTLMRCVHQLQNQYFNLTGEELPITIQSLEQ